MWIPWGDHYQENLPAIKAIAKSLDLNIHASGVRWAAYKCSKSPAPSEEIELEWVPERPALVSGKNKQSVGTRPSASKKAVWTRELNERRLVLIQKKGEQKLGPAEQSELQELQLRLRQYSNQNHPLPFDIFDE